MNLIFSPSLYLLLPLLLLIFKFIYAKFNSISTKKPLPPGPKPWPIIGNLLHLSANPHISFAHFARKHGPLFSVRLGSQLLVVGSSPLAAAEILKTQDRLLSARYIPKLTPYEPQEIERMSLVWAPWCTDYWKSSRIMCRTDLFSAKAIELQAGLREKKAAEMVEFIGSKEGRVVNIGEVVFTMVFDTLSNVFFSKDLNGFEFEGKESGLKASMGRMMKLGTTTNICDFFPFFADLDPQGLRKKAKKVLSEIFALWEPIIKERRRSHGDATSKQEDLMDVFLANNLDDDQIKSMLLELFSAGTDTTSTAIEWAMAELLHNSEAMAKLREELRREINENSINESHLSQLPYLNACVKETLRLHPPAPFLLPHRAQETCEILNYTIPKDSMVFVNVWAIGRDPGIWDDPLSFKPERFIGSKLDFKGQDFEFLPFGAGRRSCPGFPMASRQTCLILASLIHCFDWYFPNGEELDPSKIDMKAKFGITLQKELPLLFLPKRKT